MLHSLHHRELGFGLGDNGDKLIVGHVYGSLELGGISGAEGGWAAITTAWENRSIAITGGDPPRSERR